MTGQILLTIIMLLFLLIPLSLHFLNKVRLFHNYDDFTIPSSIAFLISLIYLVINLGVLIGTYWNKPMF